VTQLAWRASQKCGQAVEVNKEYMLLEVMNHQQNALLDKIDIRQAGASKTDERRLAGSRRRPWLSLIKECRSPRRMDMEKTCMPQNSKCSTRSHM
jgi:hypothetical protein